ncbi:MAG: hypothetical protein SFZ24_02995 [Planctomycetota bacterium]|nr:hypothetical protein [Planctomycetota bacterium]
MLKLVPARLTRSRVRLLAAVIALMGAGIPALPADARQAQQSWPRMVVPTSDSVAVRCGPGVAWYPIATVGPKTPLKADAEVEGWLRIEYLPGWPAVVKADEAELRESEQKVVLTRRSRLRALSSADPVFDESFRAVFEEFLAPGTEMRYIGPIKNRAGETAGYIVAAPPGAKAFISPREIRDARPEEVNPPKPAQTSTPPAAAPASTPASTPATSAPAQTGTPAPASTPSTSSPTTSTPTSATPASTTPADPATAPATTTPATDPAAVDPAAAPASQPATEIVPPPAPAQQAPAQPKGPTLRQLDRALENMLTKPLAEGDPAELIERYIAFADEAETRPGGDRLVKHVNNRLEVLRLRERARSLLPEIQALEDAARNASQNYALTIDRLIQNREYMVVGRLVPSTVYDGERLPLMYRLVSIDPAVNGTLAYIIPDPALQLEQKVNAVVGVLGEGKLEPSSMVQIVTPTVVDILRPASDLAPQTTP